MQARPNDHKTMKYLVGSSPDVELLRPSRLRKVRLPSSAGTFCKLRKKINYWGETGVAYRIKVDARDHCNAFCVVKPQSSLFVQLPVWEHGSRMDDGRESREARGNQSEQPEKSPFGTIQIGENINGPGEGSQYYDLERHGD